jgi:hypothetical protein
MSADYGGQVKQRKLTQYGDRKSFGDEISKLGKCRDDETIDDDYAVEN